MEDDKKNNLNFDNIKVESWAINNFLDSFISGSSRKILIFIFLAISSLIIYSYNIFLPVSMTLSAEIDSGKVIIKPTISEASKIKTAQSIKLEFLQNVGFASQNIASRISKVEIIKKSPLSISLSIENNTFPGLKVPAMITIVTDKVRLIKLLANKEI